MKNISHHIVCTESGEILGHDTNSDVDNIKLLFPKWKSSTALFTHNDKNIGTNLKIQTSKFELQGTSCFFVEISEAEIENTDFHTRPITLHIEVRPAVEINPPSENLIDQIISHAKIGYCNNPTYFESKISTHQISNGEEAKKALGLPFLYRIIQQAIEPESNDLDQTITCELNIHKNKLKGIYCYFHHGERPQKPAPETKLLNRKQLLDQLEFFVSKKQYFSLLMIDIDNFKTINSTLGHHLGDQVLAELSKRIFQLSQNQHGITAHLNGDKFAWIIPQASVKHNIESLAYRMLSELRKPLLINHIPLELDASIGIASYPKEGYAPMSLLRKAENAMLQAKRASFKVKDYEPDIELTPQQRLMVMAGIPSAILNKEFHLIFQPQIDFKNKQLKGFECLLRWSRNNKSFSPGIFIPLAEMSHHIHDLTKWVIKECLEQLAYWQSEGKKWTVSINFSSKNLMDTRLVNYLSRQCVKFDIPTNFVIIEVTESALMTDIESAKILLEKLHSEGFQISIDDFGTGYSSLAYLKHLPVNMIKIDQTFVKDVALNKTDATICKSLIEMAHELNIEVVAEGIENSASFNKIKLLKGDYAQGYFISKGIAPDKVFKFAEKLLRQPPN